MRFTISPLLFLAAFMALGATTSMAQDNSPSSVETSIQSSASPSESSSQSQTESATSPTQTNSATESQTQSSESNRETASRSGNNSNRASTTASTTAKNLPTAASTVGNGNAGGDDTITAPNPGSTFKNAGPDDSYHVDAASGLVSRTTAMTIGLGSLVGALLVF